MRTTTDANLVRVLNPSFFSDVESSTSAATSSHSIFAEASLSEGGDQHQSEVCPKQPYYFIIYKRHNLNLMHSDIYMFYCIYILIINFFLAFQIKTGYFIFFC